MSLKSTYQPAPPPVQEPPLSPGWSEYAAPTGHKYYYNAATKSSTYTRPAPGPPAPVPQSLGDFIPLNDSGPSFNSYAQPQPFNPQHQLSSISDRPAPSPRYERRGLPPDRPKSKHELPGCAPWVLVKTRLGRRFAHNTETGISLWKIPADVNSAVEAFDVQERKNREEGTGANATKVNKRKPKAALGDSEHAEPIGQGEDGEKILENIAGTYDEGEESYDEVIEEEVTDDEAGDADGPNKRPRLDQNENPEGNPTDDAPEAMEFTEDDIAAQLAAMGQSYDAESGEYAEHNEAEDEEAGMEITPEEAQTLFHALLDDANINPYTTCDALITSPAGTRLIEDDRYTLLPNMRARKSAFAAWSAIAIERQKAQKAREAKLDPRVPYLDLLTNEATPKLYWPEFRKKFRKDPVMQSSRLGDKEREKLYRDYVSRVTKKSAEERKDDLWELCKSLPVSLKWNGDTSVESLPQSLLADVRWAALKQSTRERLAGDFLRRLPLADELHEAVDADDREERKERRRKEEALKEREREVLEQKRRAMRDKGRGREELLREEDELRDAMRVGRSGLRDQLGE